MREHRGSGLGSPNVLARRRRQFDAGLGVRSGSHDSSTAIALEKPSALNERKPLSPAF